MNKQIPPRYLNRIDINKDPDGSIDVMVPPAMAAEFITAIKRACSTWQDISPQFRDFADRLTGVAHIMGDNMKSSIATEFVKPVANNMLAERTRDCCHTMLKEPHHTQCPEKDKVASYVKPELATATKLWPRTKSG